MALLSFGLQPVYRLGLFGNAVFDPQHVYLHNELGVQGSGYLAPVITPRFGGKVALRLSPRWRLVRLRQKRCLRSAHSPPTVLPTSCLRREILAKYRQRAAV